MGFCDRGRVEPSRSGECHRLTTGNWRPPEGYVVSFMAFHERGFGVPASPFMRALLHYYNVELHHLAPNSISQATIFRGGLRGIPGDGATVESMAPPL
jgi:hypothetical protein